MRTSLIWGGELHRPPSLQSLSLLSLPLSRPGLTGNILEAFRRSATWMSLSWSPLEDTFVFEVDNLTSSGEEGDDDTDKVTGGPDDNDLRLLRFFIGNALLGKVVLLMAVVEVPPVNIAVGRNHLPSLPSPCSSCSSPPPLRLDVMMTGGGNSDNYPSTRRATNSELPIL